MKDRRYSSFLIPQPSFLGLTGSVFSVASVVMPVSVLGE
jgi:hypothetical protein